MGEPGVRRVYRFGPFRLDIREAVFARLRSDPVAAPGVRDAPRARRERRAARDETGVAGRGVARNAVEENNLNHNVSVLRKALQEKATGQQYIETVPRVGYRFVARSKVSSPKPPPIPVIGA